MEPWMLIPGLVACATCTAFMSRMGEGAGNKKALRQEGSHVFNG